MIPGSLKAWSNHVLKAKQRKLKYVIHISNMFIFMSPLYFKGNFWALWVGWLSFVSNTATLLLAAGGSQTEPMGHNKMNKWKSIYY